jgi:hypothetical protein
MCQNRDKKFNSVVIILIVATFITVASVLAALQLDVLHKTNGLKTALHDLNKATECHKQIVEEGAMETAVLDYAEKCTRAE